MFLNDMSFFQISGHFVDYLTSWPLDANKKNRAYKTYDFFPSKWKKRHDSMWRKCLLLSTNIVIRDMKANVCMVAYVKLIRIWNLKGPRWGKPFFAFLAFWRQHFQQETEYYRVFLYNRPDFNKISLEMGDICVNISELVHKRQQNVLKTWFFGFGLPYLKLCFQHLEQGSKYILQGLKLDWYERPILILSSPNITLICYGNLLD